MKPVNIKEKVLSIPIIQGGMGIGVSLGNLAGSVMKEGGMGVISTANPGYKHSEFYKNPLKANLEQLGMEIEKAKSLAKERGLLAVNVMVAGNNYAEIVKEAVKNKVDAVISGAGLPLDLPQFLKGTQIAMAPIVSSGKAAGLICKKWAKSYDVAPDFIVVEGPEAGGHLGFSKASIMDKTYQSLEDIFLDVKEAVLPYREKFSKAIPIFVAGGIFTGQDIAKFLKLGADGVQMGTRFIGTHECDASDEYKSQFLNANQEDVILVPSPVGLPGRALKNSFSNLIQNGKVPVKRCFNCLIPCNPKDTPYCISAGLIEAVSGTAGDGLVFTGSNGYRVNQLTSVKNLIEELVADCTQSLQV